MQKISIAVVAPSGSFKEERLSQAIERASAWGFCVRHPSSSRFTEPSFLNGSRDARLHELVNAEKLDVDAIWCMRGGVGAIELWPYYTKEIYQHSHAPLIGFSDISLYHFMRYYRASRIGIHGPILGDLIDSETIDIEALNLILRKQAHRLVYPALTNLNQCLGSQIVGELIPMNLTSLLSIIGCFDHQFLCGKIIAIEDVNEPHYKIFRAIHQLKNARLLSGVKALLIGTLGPDRKAIIKQSILPLANDEGISVFDWPIFGHERPNWPLLFGAKVSINKVDSPFYTLHYHEQYDRTPITITP